jgi:thiosulfate dehydrogenase [quinone] large subunit
VHGVSRLYSGVDAFAHELAALFSTTPLQGAAMYAFGVILPWAETVLGLFVFIGAASRYAYALGMLSIAGLTFGSTLRQDWLSAGLQLTYAMVYAVLLAARQYNSFSVDAWIAGRTEHARRAEHDSMAS